MRNLRFLFTTFFIITALSILLVQPFVRTKDAPSAPLTVVASFYPVYIAAEYLLDGVDDVQLNNLSEPQTGCLHDYTLTPADMKLLSTADAFAINGGGIEAFLPDVAAAYPSLTVIDTGSGLSLSDEASFNQDEADEEEENAHYWMSIPLYMQQIQALRDGLCALCHNHDGAVSRIQQNAASYFEHLEELHHRQSAIASRLSGTKVILFHEAYEWVAGDYQMEPVFLLDLDEERQVSAGEIADVMNAIEKDQVPLVLAEEQYGKELGDLVATETGVSVVYLDTIVRGDNADAKDAYLTRMADNLRLLESFLTDNGL